MFVFLRGNVSDGFSAIGPYWTFDQAVDSNLEHDGWVMEVNPPAGQSSWENDFVQFPRLLSEIYSNIEISEKDMESLCSSMDLGKSDVMDLLSRADTVWQDLKTCESCGGIGWLDTTEDKIERCDSCKKFDNDDEAEAAFKKRNA